MKRLSVIIPVLNEEDRVGDLVTRVGKGIRAGDEVLVVDGGSTDGSVAAAGAAGARVLPAPRGRGRQMAAGAEEATGEVLLFLHADTRLPPAFRAAIKQVLDDVDVGWGRFDLGFDEGGRLLALIAALINARSRLMRSATGDQAIFVRRDVYGRVGGFLEPHLFEDVDLVRRLRRVSRMGVPRGCVTTSARRWRKEGVWRTTVRMWALKSAYLCGVPARRLARYYRDVR